MGRKLKMSREKIIISVLVILLIISVGYIVVNSFVEKLQAEAQQAFQNGYNQGINDAVVTLYQQTENCQPATIRIGNVTREVIDTACLILEQG